MYLGENCEVGTKKNMYVGEHCQVGTKKYLVNICFSEANCLFHAVNDTRNKTKIEPSRRTSLRNQSQIRKSYSIPIRGPDGLV